MFEGMLALPDSPSQDVYDGVPLVHFADSAEDIYDILSIFYDPTSLTFSRYDPYIPLRLTNIMKLATKHQINSLRSRIIGILHDSRSPLSSSYNSGPRQRSCGVRIKNMLGTLWTENSLTTAFQSLFPQFALRATLTYHPSSRTRTMPSPEEPARPNGTSPAAIPIKGGRWRLRRFAPTLDGRRYWRLSTFRSSRPFGNASQKMLAPL
ncbi:hypothetical protein PHLGIDRAFT_429004 [Phlebiopsis gigantea 11061_1 CR5-6]|uniref:BTB domain-containing protein n=1 Tax=Phlebiopsis gigantea (strain 11061_1 CR5-6) TaxID=745531 RepID=A0A0C3SAM5_PHLG1|nr:hypothetical protein PHLGIDRAFT_429004 [Phlebiopsis gigantea 11061_1 CR5-6]